jgi:O-6-methylguanine DNA methyltransferase
MKQNFGENCYNIVMTFKEKVNTVVRRIQRGKTMTYMQVAKAAGSPHAFRAVGNILNGNYDLAIPCHRVVRSDGTVGGYNRGVKKKAEMLRRERN